MTNEFDILKLVCNALDQAAIPYMLTGSFAANFYAVPRMTRDIDIVIEIRPANLTQFIELFQNEFLISETAIREAMKYQGMFNLIHKQSIIKVDLIIRKNLDYRFVEFQRRKRVVYSGIPVWIVSLEDLVISKLYWAKDSFSELQIKDVKNLLKNVGNFDIDYLNRWVAELKLESIYEKIKKDE